MQRTSPNKKHPDRRFPHLLEPRQERTASFSTLDYGDLPPFPTRREEQKLGRSIYQHRNKILKLLRKERLYQKHRRRITTTPPHDQHIPPQQETYSYLSFTTQKALTAYEHAPPHKKAVFKQLVDLSLKRDSLVQQLVLSHLRLAMRLARDIQTSAPYEDRAERAIFRMYRAALYYNPYGHRGVRFTSYAGRSIYRELSEDFRTPVPEHPDTHSLFAPLQPTSKKTLIEMLEDTNLPQPPTEAARREESQFIRDTLKEHLSPMERFIIEAYYGINGYQEHTQGEIAEELAKLGYKDRIVSQTRIGHIQKRALMKLYDALLPSYPHFFPHASPP